MDSSSIVANKLLVVAIPRGGREGAKGGCSFRRVMQQQPGNISKDSLLLLNSGDLFRRDSIPVLQFLRD